MTDPTGNTCDSELYEFDSKRKIRFNGKTMKKIVYDADYARTFRIEDTNSLVFQVPDMSVEPIALQEGFYEVLIEARLKYYTQPHSEGLVAALLYDRLTYEKYPCLPDISATEAQFSTLSLPSISIELGGK